MSRIMWIVTSIKDLADFKHVLVKLFLCLKSSLVLESVNPSILPNSNASCLVIGHHLPQLRKKFSVTEQLCA